MEISAEHSATSEHQGDLNKAEKRIYVVDDDSSIRKSLHFLLAATGINVWPFASARDFLDQVEFLTPAQILLDIRMPDIDGIGLLEMLKDRNLSWPVIILTAHGDIAVAVRAMRLGAIDILTKPCASETLEQALSEAFALLDQTKHVKSARDQARCRISQLSARERETMSILMEGAANKEVAHRLGLSIRTVEMHRSNALSKLGVKSIAEVVVLANMAGLTAEMRLNLE